MRTLLAAALFLLCGVPLQAQEPVPPGLIVTRTGFFFVYEQEDGAPLILRASNVMVVGQPGPIPGPPGPDTPQPPPISPVIQQVRQFTQQVNHPQGAAALQLVYNMVADQADAGQVRPENVYDAVRLASNQILDSLDATERWAGWRASVSQMITAKMQAGDLQHPKDVTRMFREIAIGLGFTNTPSAEPALPAEVQGDMSKIVDHVLGLLNEDGDSLI